MNSYSFKAKNSDEMVKLGGEVAKIVMQNPAILFLEGDLGAGKTTLTQGIAQSLGINEEITSPSFVINKKYYREEKPILSHYDFYRLENNVGIMKDELSEDVSSGALVVIEWGHEIDEILPEKYWKARLTQDEKGDRDIELMEIKK